MVEYYAAILIRIALNSAVGRVQAIWGCGARLWNPNRCYLLFLQNDIHNTAEAWIQSDWELLGAVLELGFGRFWAA